MNAGTEDSRHPGERSESGTFRIGSRSANRSSVTFGHSILIEAFRRKRVRLKLFLKLVTKDATVPTIVLYKNKNASTCLLRRFMNSI
jgi:hypothetical protein